MPTNLDLTLRLFLQIAVILIACKVIGRMVRFLGQTQVIGEMVAGVLLGPSVFGLLAPGLQHSLFPATLTVGVTATTVRHPSMMLLYAISQIGLVLYMFVTGLQFNTELLGQHFRHTGRISAAGVIAPLLFGGLMGWQLSGDGRLFAGSVAPWQAALFLASAMSVTAFPVLVRILHDMGLTHTKIGTLTIGAAAFDDAMAWSLLAIVLATAGHSPTVAGLAIGGGLSYLLVMLFAGRSLFRRFEHAADNGLRPETLSLLLLILMLCAYFTDAVGIHSVFGAFILGAVMPRGRFTDACVTVIEPVTVGLLVPIFFAFSGLNTHFGLLVQPALLGIAAATILVAFVCKGGACLLASRRGGTSWREAAMIGSLMNARGLMELILINIGLEKGLITPALFTMLVLMTIITTFAAAPLFRLASGKTRPI